MPTHDADPGVTAATAGQPCNTRQAPSSMSAEALAWHLLVCMTLCAAQQPHAVRMLLWVLHAACLLSLAAGLVAGCP